MREGTPAPPQGAARSVPGAHRVAIGQEADVAAARRLARRVAEQEGMGEGAVGALVTAVSEVARNIVVHARRGEVVVELVRVGARRAIAVIARDEGPGIEDLQAAMRDGYSTRGGLGLGLPSARRLMDEFSIVSAAGEGTTVCMKKWVHGAG